ncbi:hypothetical protein [Streptomyces bambusae]
MDYHGSQTRLHGRYQARPETGCPYRRAHEEDDRYPTDRLILSNPATGADVLFCVRPTSVTEIAPDGQPLNHPATEGDWILLPGGALAIFAWQEPAHRFGSDPCDEIHYYAHSGGRWYIHHRLIPLRGAPITRARYTSPQDRAVRLLTIAQEDHIACLREFQDRPDAPAFEREADDLERLTQKLEALNTSPDRSVLAASGPRSGQA